MLTLYDDIRSGDGLKVEGLLDAIGRDCQWIEVDILSGTTIQPCAAGVVGAEAAIKP